MNISVCACSLVRLSGSVWSCLATCTLIVYSFVFFRGSSCTTTALPTFCYLAFPFIDTALGGVTAISPKCQFNWRYRTAIKSHDLHLRMDFALLSVIDACCSLSL